MIVHHQVRGYLQMFGVTFMRVRIATVPAEAGLGVPPILLAAIRKAQVAPIRQM